MMPSVWINEHWKIFLQGHAQSENLSRAENRKDIKEEGKLSLQSMPAIMLCKVENAVR